MISATIGVNEYKALQLVTAKKDVRYYLNGFHLNVPEKRIEATNGHRLLRISDINIESNVDGIINSASYHPYILKAEIKPPRGTVTVRFNLDVNNVSIEFIDKLNHTLLSFKPELLDGVFPDTDRVIPDAGLQQEFNELCFNPVYLADVAKIYSPKFPAIKLKFYSSSMTVNFNKNVLLVVMPMRDPDLDD